MFGGRYLRQRTALGSESTALQTETTLGLPTGQKRRICGKNVINLLIFWVFSHFFGQKFSGRSVADPRYFFGFFHLFFCFSVCNFWQIDLWRILGHSLVFSGSQSNACRTHLPTGKKKKRKKQTGKPRLNLTRSLQQGNSR